MESKRTYELQTGSSERQHKYRKVVHDLFRNSPIPVEERIVNHGLFTPSGAFAKWLFLDEIYRKITRRQKTASRTHEGT